MRIWQALPTKLTTAMPQLVPPGAVVSGFWQCCLGLLKQDMQLFNLFVLSGQLFLLSFHLFLLCYYLRLEHCYHLFQPADFTLAARVAPRGVCYGLCKGDALVV